MFEHLSLVLNHWYYIIGVKNISIKFPFVNCLKLFIYKIKFRIIQLEIKYRKIEITAVLCVNSIDCVILLLQLTIKILTEISMIINGTNFNTVIWIRQKKLTGALQSLFPSEAFQWYLTDIAIFLYFELFHCPLKMQLNIWNVYISYHIHYFGNDMYILICK